MKQIVFAVGVMLFLGLWGCDTRRTVTIPQLNEYLADSDNGLQYTEKDGDARLEIEYHPKDLVVKQQLEDVTDPAERAAVKRQYDSLDYFVLRFSNKDKEIENSYVSNPAGLADVVHYFSQGILDDMFMITPTDTLRPVDVAYMRTFGMSHASSVMVVFKSYLAQRDGTVEVYLQDRLLHTGTNKFSIHTHDIKNIPALKVD
ncbi:MAG TPA: hypothetical protein VIU12_32085 [Chryseolinea sp.]